jgi:hypothetical protein
MHRAAGSRRVLRRDGYLIGPPAAPRVAADDPVIIDRQPRWESGRPVAQRPPGRLLERVDRQRHLPRGAAALVPRVDQADLAGVEGTEVRGAGAIHAADGAAAGVLPERPGGPAGRHRRPGEPVGRDPRRVRGEGPAPAGAGVPPARHGVDDGQLPGKVPDSRDERGDPRSHLGAAEPVALVGVVAVHVRVVLDVQHQRQHLRAGGVPPVPERVPRLRGAAADVGDREVVGSDVQSGGLGGGEVGRGPRIDVVVALGGLDGGELVAGPGDQGPVDAGPARVLVPGNVDPAHREARSAAACAAGTRGAGEFAQQPRRMRQGGGGRARGGERRGRSHRGGRRGRTRGGEQGKRRRGYRASRFEKHHTAHAKARGSDHL